MHRQESSINLQTSYMSYFDIYPSVLQTLTSRKEIAPQDAWLRMLQGPLAARCLPVLITKTNWLSQNVLKLINYFICRPAPALSDAG